jgi:hypothetical protein
MFPEIVPPHSVIIKFTDLGNGQRQINVPFEV